MRIVPEGWGFCMRGNEEAFCDALDVAMEYNPPDSEFVYFEIGIGNGDTIESVASWLVQSEQKYLIVGVDLPNYTGSVNNKSWPKFENQKEGLTLALVGSEEFLTRAKLKANFIFIDACHGAPCVTLDFLLAENHIKKGGVIAFHDTDPICQGQHFQEHCGTGIDVRRALEELGLMNDTRKGWRKINETWGLKPGNHGCCFFQYD